MSTRSEAFKELSNVINTYNLDELLIEASKTPLLKFQNKYQFSTMLCEAIIRLAPKVVLLPIKFQHPPSTSQIKELHFHNITKHIEATETRKQRDHQIYHLSKIMGISHSKTGNSTIVRLIVKIYENLKINNRIDNIKEFEINLMKKASENNKKLIDKKALEKIQKQKDEIKANQPIRRTILANIDKDLNSIKKKFKSIGYDISHFTVDDFNYFDHEIKFD